MIIINHDHPYYKEFVQIYNASVKHDERLGKHDHQFAYDYAKQFADEKITSWHKDIFLEHFAIFYERHFN